MPLGRPHIGARRSPPPESTARPSVQQDGSGPLPVPASTTWVAWWAGQLHHYVGVGEYVGLDNSSAELAELVPVAARPTSPSPYTVVAKGVGRENLPGEDPWSRWSRANGPVLALVSSGRPPRASRAVAVVRTRRRLSREPDALHDLVVGRTGSVCRPGVAADAAGKLGGMRAGGGDQLLGRLRQRASAKTSQLKAVNAS